MLERKRPPAACQAASVPIFRSRYGKRRDAIANGYGPLMPGRLACQAAALAALAVVGLGRPAAGQGVQAPRPGVTPPGSLEVAPPTLRYGSTAPGAVPGERLVVLDPTAGRVVLVDPVDRTVLAVIPTGPEARRMAISADGRHAYVANYTRGGPSVYGRGASGSVTVLDLEAATVERTLYPFRAAAGQVLDVTFHSLHDIQVNGGGARLFLTAEADSGILELDARSGEVLMLWKTGAAMSHTLVTTRDGRRLFVANRDSDSITVIDRLYVTAQRVPTGRAPEGMALSPSASELWVTNRADHTITVIDARRYRPLATIPSGGRDPSHVVFRPDGAEAWVANRESRELAVFDVRTRELLATVPLEFEPRALVFAPGGERVYVTAPQVGRVVVVDTRWRHVLDSFETGGAPSLLAWSRSGPVTASGQ